MCSPMVLACISGIPKGGFSEFHLDELPNMARRTLRGKTFRVVANRHLMLVEGNYRTRLANVLILGFKQVAYYGLYGVV